MFSRRPPRLSSHLRIASAPPHSSGAGCVPRGAHPREGVADGRLPRATAKLWVALALSLGLSACTLSNMTPQARFSDAAHTLNDAARWGRVDIASQYVAPEYLERFRSRRTGWGREVSIADADLTAMQLASDHDSAVTEVSLSWYDTHGVSLRNSVILQKWEARRGTFKLIDESIQSGDPRIFADEQTEGDEAPTEP